MTWAGRVAAFLAVMLLPACIATPGPAPSPDSERLSGRLVVVTDVLLPDRPVTGDVDDVLALQLLAAAGIRPAAVVAVAGNGSERHVQRSLRRFAALGHGVAGVGGCAANGTAALVRALRSGPTTLLVLAPATVVAEVLACAPDARGNVAGIVFVGGRRPGEEFRLASWVPRFVPPLRDFNYELDRAAVAALIDANLPLTLVPFAAGSAVRLFPAEIAPHFDDRADEAFASHAASLLPVGGGGGLPAFDPVAAGYLLWPSLFTCNPVAVRAGRELVATPAADGSARLCLPGRPEAVRAAILSTLRAG